MSRVQPPAEPVPLSQPFGLLNATSGVGGQVVSPGWMKLSMRNGAFDQTFSALVLDLEQRGLLDETLVLVLSEHGRTPQIDSKPKGAGRHHWSRAYSTVFAGGGIAKGKIVGSSDKHAGDVRDSPISPKDILATAFYLLGIDPHTTVPDQQGRPMPIAGDGKLRPELLA